MGRRARREHDDRTWGMRVTEAFLPFFGPASIRKTPPIPPTAEDVARDTALRSSLERVTRADGHVYLVERED
ncbi:hypothetical protein M1843_04055 [Isoptericola sp. 4D.3]|jgi:hypothetical protein|uniref:Uncharacterized protein n=1 Tax=Isoptericola peretonis TaxID=2918523 RepID=A0ABT0J095_9MICO|nr:hypothetical protein [Isoptericola sp. 4D.3]